MGRILGFLAYAVMGFLFIGWGIYGFSPKKKAAFGFWAGGETFPTDDIRGYNRAVGKLWIAIGIITIVLGLPLIPEQNAPGIIISILGLMAESIGAMVVHELVIAPKFRRR